MIGALDSKGKVKQNENEIKNSKLIIIIIIPI
jgi:hypothetical protein